MTLGVNSFAGGPNNAGPTWDSGVGDATPGAIRQLADRQLTAARVPDAVRVEYWR